MDNSKEEYLKELASDKKIVINEEDLEALTKPKEITEFKISWDTVYLLGYETYDPYKHGGWKSHLTTWDDPYYRTPMVDVIVTGTFSPPMWNSPVPKGAEIHQIPEGRDKYEYANELGGLPAFGWYFDNGVTRK